MLTLAKIEQIMNPIIIIIEKNVITLINKLFVL